MAEKTPNQQLAEKLLYTPASVADSLDVVTLMALDFAVGYIQFRDAGQP